MSATNSNFSPTAGPMLVICSSTEIILKLTLSGLSCSFFHTCRPQTGGEVKNPDKGGPARNERPVRLICLRLGGGQGGFSPWGGRKPPDLSSRRPAGPGPWRPNSLSRPLGKARAVLIISLAGMEGARVIGLLGLQCQLSLRQHPAKMCDSGNGFERPEAEYAGDASPGRGCLFLFWGLVGLGAI